MNRIPRLDFGRKSFLYLILILLLTILLFVCKFSYINHQQRKENENGLSIYRRNTPLTQKIKCYIFLLILAGPTSKLKRQAMRETWLTTTKVGQMSIQRRFIIGSKGLSSIAMKLLEEEQSKYSDLLLLKDFKDSYKKLTEKLLRAFIWINDNVEAEFIMKADDDTFVRVDKLLPSIYKKSFLGRIYWGFFRGNAKVKRSGPWLEEKWFLAEQYLPYALGGGYLLSFDLVEYISKNANDLILYNSEDISVGR